MKREQIRKKTDKLRKKYETDDPFSLAKDLGIEVIIGNLGSRYGCYMYLKKHKCIFLNENLSKKNMQFVMAHELGHAVLHPKENFYFLRNCTFMADQMEKEANLFAVELLLPYDLHEYEGCTAEQLSMIFGYDERIIRLRWKIFE